LSYNADAPSKIKEDTPLLFHGNQFSLTAKIEQIFSGSSRQSNISLEIGRLDAVLFL
jgi:hypothetical protein